MFLIFAAICWSFFSFSLSYKSGPVEDIKTNSAEIVLLPKNLKVYLNYCIRIMT